MKNLTGIGLVTALLLAPGAIAQDRTYDQDKMKANFEEMLGHDWYVDGGWTVDFEAAKATAREAGLPILAYFTRTYAP